MPRALLECSLVSEFLMGKSCVDLLMVDCRQELLQLVWKLKGPLGVVEQLTEGVFVDACGWLSFQSPELSTDHA